MEDQRNEALHHGWIQGDSGVLRLLGRHETDNKVVYTLSAGATIDGVLPPN